MTTSTRSPAPVWGIILACAAIAILEGFDIQAIGIAAPKLIPQLGLDPAQAGQAFGFGQFGLVAGALVGGWLSDRIGRKTILMISILIFGVFTLATLYANSFDTLVAVRVATGLGLGSAMPNLIRLALEAAKPGNRAFMVTLVMAGTPLGGALVSLFARLYMAQLGWHSLFLLGGVLPILLAPVVAMLPSETKAAAGEMAKPRVFGPVALFGNGKAATTLLLWVASFLTLIVLYLFLNWLPSLMAGLGKPPAIGQDASLCFNLGSVAGALIIGWITDRLGARWPVTLAYLGLIAGVCGLAFLRADAQMLISAAATGFCVLGAQYALAGVGATYYPTASRGLATGAALAVGRVGSILGPMLAGEVLHRGYGPNGVLTVLVPVAAIAGLSVFCLTSIAKPAED